MGSMCRIIATYDFHSKTIVDYTIHFAKISISLQTIKGYITFIVRRQDLDDFR